MLTRFHKILLGLLVVQLVLVVVVLVRGEDVAALKEHPLFPGFDAAKVSRLQVFGPPDAANGSGGSNGPNGKDGKDAKPIDLVKRDKAWVLASGYDFPVVEQRATDVLTPIGKLAAASPIATGAGRRKQLRVADDDFERKLVITADGKDLTLYLGSSTGARRTALRIAGSDDIYAVSGMAPSVAPSDVRQWIDPTYVKVAAADVAKVSVQKSAGGSLELYRTTEEPPAAGSGSAAGSGKAAGSGSAAAPSAPSAPAAEHWAATLDGAPVVPGKGEVIDQGEIDKLINQVVNLDVNAPGDPKRDASKPTATITIDRKASGAASPAPIVIDVIADGASYWIHDRSSPRAAMVDKARLDGVLTADQPKLVKTPVPPGAMPGGGEAPPHPAMPGMPGLPPGMANPHGGGAPPPQGGW